MSTTNIEATASHASSQPQIEEEDLPLLRQLARLQELHDQLNSLRTLLPRRLLAPITSALHPNGTIKSSALPSKRPHASSTVDGARRAPNALFSDLQRIANDGVDEVERFKSAWDDESMEKLWDMGKDVNMAGFEGPQGNDVWDVDYVGVMRRHDMGTLDAGTGEGSKIPLEEGENATEDGSEDTERVVEEANTAKTGIKIQKMEADQGDTSPIFKVVVRGGLRLEVQLQGRLWTASPSKESPTNDILHSILEQLNNRPNKASLRYLLDMISSYNSIRTQPCNKCLKVFDKKLQLPYIRKNEETLTTLKAEEGTTTTTPKERKWLAYHPDCCI